MANLREAIDSVSKAIDSKKEVDIEKLSDLVAAQLDNVLGGGYSQYTLTATGVVHSKDGG